MTFLAAVSVECFSSWGVARRPRDLLACDVYSIKQPKLEIHS